LQKSVQLADLRSTRPKGEVGDWHKTRFVFCSGISFSGRADGPDFALGAPLV